MCPHSNMKTSEPLPGRMTHLPVSRGFVVPWFVAWIDGVPEFRSMDAVKYFAALRKKLCWVCGQRLGVNVCFVAGPMCGINRTSSEPPSHVECARWSARNCPFLNNPNMVRREDDVVNNTTTRENAAGICITRNPGVAMLWLTRQFEVFYPDRKKQPLIQMGEPESVEWYAHGRVATRAEVLASIESGLPNLEAIAMTERGGLEALEVFKKRFERWIPA